MRLSILLLLLLPVPVQAATGRPEMIRQALAAVVQVQVAQPETGGTGPTEGLPLSDALRRGGGTAMSLGSGFIVAAEGLIVTNAHVLGLRPGLVTVRLADGSQRPASIVGRDDKTDLAVLRLEPGARYPILAWGDSEALRIGDDVVAVGSPFGLGGSVTAGIVSGRGRTIGAGPYDDFLQIDAPINQGNSGGPLLDAAGRVMGVNTAILAPAGGNVGIGFSIPASVARTVVDKLVTRGRIRHGQIGIEVEGVSADIADALGLGRRRGALVASVRADSPAAGSGLRPGDVVLMAAGRPIDGIADLSAVLADADAGHPLRLQVWRDGTMIAGEVTPTALPDTDARQRDLDSFVAPAARTTLLGVTLATTSPLLNEAAGQPETATGLLVLDVASSASAAGQGLAEGDVVTAANGTPLTGAADLARVLTSAQQAGRHNILLTIEHGDRREYLALPIVTSP